MTSLTAHQLISVDGKISVHGKENSKPTENTNAASASNLLQSDLKRTQNETQKKDQSGDVKEFICQFSLI